MATKSVYLSQPVLEGGLIRIRDDEHRHLSVARAGVNESIEVFDGRGHIWDAVIAAVDRRETLARVTGSRTVEPDPHELILGQSLIRSSAFEAAVEKAVETGVTRIIPIRAARSNVKDWKADRWHRIIIEAAKQSKRYHLPVLEEPVSFLTILGVDAPAKLMFAERNGVPLNGIILKSPVLYLIGPEGGWADEELSSARQNGFTWVGLGTTILRSETAAVVATALVRYELESLGSKGRII